MSLCLMQSERIGSTFLSRGGSGRLFFQVRGRLQGSQRPNLQSISLLVRYLDPQSFVKDSESVFFVGLSYRAFPDYRSHFLTMSVTVVNGG